MDYICIWEDCIWAFRWTLIDACSKWKQCKSDRKNGATQQLGIVIKANLEANEEECCNNGNKQTNRKQLRLWQLQTLLTPSPFLFLSLSLSVLLT